MKRSILLVGVMWVFALVVGAGVEAAPGSRASLSVSPDPCGFPGTYTVTGSGFDPGRRVAVTMSRQCSDGVTYNYLVYYGLADARGNISFSRDTETCTGTYTLSAQQSTRGKDAPATTSFTVQ